MFQNQAHLVQLEIHIAARKLENENYLHEIIHQEAQRMLAYFEERQQAMQAHLDENEQMRVEIAKLKTRLDGLNADELINEQAAQGGVHLANRVNQLMSQLVELIEIDEREREERVEEARGLAPREAQVYCGQLSERLNELKRTVCQQQKEFDVAEKETHQQYEQNANLVASIVQMREKIKRDKGSSSYACFQGELYKAGQGLSEYIGLK